MLELDNLCIAYLLKELKPLLIGSYINKIQEVKKGIFKFKLHTKEGTKDLIVLAKAFYFTQYKFKAPLQPHGYSLFLRKRLANEKILDVRQHNFERIVIFETKNYLLILEFFANGNIILCDKELNVLMPFRKEIWKDREIKKQTKYVFPKTQKLEPPLKVSDVENLLKEKNFRELLKHINVAPIYLEEALKESNSSAEKFVRILNDIYKVDERRKFVRLVEHKGTKKLIPIKLKHFKVLKEFENINDALDGLFSERILQKDKISAAEKKEQKIRELLHSLDEIKQKEKEYAIQAEELKKSAEWIYLHYADVQKLIEICRECIKKDIAESEILRKIKESGIKFKMKIDKVKKEVEIEV